MKHRVLIFAAALAGLTAATTAPLHAAPLHAAPPAAPDLALSPRTGPPVVLAASALARMPSVTVVASFTGEHAAAPATFAGPLLWTILAQIPGVAAGTPRDQAGQVVRVQGADGYDAVLALGKIAPGLEAKQVILAQTENGRTLPPGHLRLVIPNDRHGARSVRDVVAIAILAP